MNCTKTQSLAIDFINDEVDSIIKKEIDNHILSCTECHSYILFTKNVFDQIDKEKINNPIPLFYDEIKEKLDDNKKKFSIYRYIKIASAVAAIFIAMLGGNYFGNYSLIATDNKYAEIVTEDVIDIDLADNNFDIFKNF